MDVEQLKDIITIVTGILAIPPTLFGIPVTYFHIRKTIIEIRKLELETAEAREKLGLKPNESPEPFQIFINNTDPGKTILVSTDPRLLTPLLLLLNFAIVGIILILLNYVLRVGFFGFYSPIQSLVMFIIAAILLTPILREAFRVRKNLSIPKLLEKEKGHEEDK